MVPAANAVTTSPTTVIGQVRPSPLHIGPKAAERRIVRVLDAGQAEHRADHFGRLVPTERLPDRPADRDAAAESGPETGFPGPADPRPTTRPSTVATTAREAVPPASTPTTSSMVEIET